LLPRVGLMSFTETSLLRSMLPEEEEIPATFIANF
jgi:hypothetical protein